MNSILIVSPKKEGNTYQVASYLKANSDAEMYVIDGGWKPDIEKYEHIILCSGIYADKVHCDLVKWLQEIDSKKVQKNTKIHLLLTWFGRGKSDLHAMQQVEKILNEKELCFNINYGTCLGGKSIIRSGHPDGADFSQALSWMREQTNLNFTNP